ncbi:RNA-directed DNA polymerase from mobile element jockey-like protein, partial [Leptotrombidium deliense]
MYETYKRIRNKLTSVIRSEKKKASVRILEENKSKPKKLWDILLDKFGRKAKKRLVDFDITQLNNHFCKYGEGHSSFVLDTEPSQEGFQFTSVSDEDVLRSFKHLKNSKSVGADNISLTMAKMALPFILPHITALFNLILKTGVYPQIWKIAKVTAVEKKAKPSSPADFRPISVLCLFSKVFERLLHEQLYAHLATNNLLSSNQFGFRSNVSTVDALLAVQYDILNARNNRQLAAMVQLDLSDAFGSVPHKLLLE